MKTPSKNRVPPRVRSFALYLSCVFVLAQMLIGCPSGTAITETGSADGAPSPVTLFPAVERTPTSLSLYWSVSFEEDFAAYTVLRGQTPGVSEDSGEIVGSMSDAADASITETGLAPDTTYYYRVAVIDADGLTSLSNEIEASTEPHPDAGPPAAVTLYSPAQQRASSISLIWTSNQNEDFDHYSVLRGDTPGVTAANGLFLDDLGQTAVTYQDTGLTAETTYYYAILVEDTEGLSSLSNEVAGTTLAAEMPTPVALGPVFNIQHDSLSLSWTQSTDEDFEKYELYRAQEPGVTTAGALVAGITEPTETIFQDTGLDVYDRYFYRLWVFNAAGQSAPSNEVSGVTSYEAPPASVTLEDPSDITGTSMTLSWGQSRSLDFAGYQLYRSEEELVDEDATLIYETPDQNSLFFIDDELAPNTTYYYRVYVTDIWNIASGSNVVHAETLNTEAPVCEISWSSPWKRVGDAFEFTAINCADNATAPEDLQVRWVFGDGSDGTEYGTARTASHAYSERGVYWVVLWVFDGTYSANTKAPVIAGDVVQLVEDDVTMGRASGTTPWPSMEPPRTVHVDGFYMDTYEVTNAELAAFLSDGNASEYFTGHEVVDNADGTYDPVIDLEEWPATGVHWYNAVAFCEWAGKRLPTEAEWEYAARGPADGPNYVFPWGNTLPEGVYPVPANYAELVGTVVAVGSYGNGVTAWDGSVVLHDMAGNAAEWVHDLYDPDYYAWANANSDNDNPTGPEESPFVPDEPAYRVARGGAFPNDENPLRVDFRTYADPLLRGSARGFRCVAETLP